MRTIEEAIMTRLTGDSVDINGTCLQNLLTGAGRVRHGRERSTPKAPGVYYESMSNAPGSINSDNVKTSSELYQIRVYADNYENVLYRLRQLLDGYTFPDQTDTGSIRSIWDSDGPDLFDDSMELKIKTVVFRIFMVPKAAAVI